MLDFISGERSLGRVRTSSSSRGVAPQRSTAVESSASHSRRKSCSSGSLHSSRLLSTVQVSSCCVASKLAGCESPTRSHSPTVSAIQTDCGSESDRRTSNVPHAASTTSLGTRAGPPAKIWRAAGVSLAYMSGGGGSLRCGGATPPPPAPDPDPAAPPPLVPVLAAILAVLAATRRAFSRSKVRRTSNLTSSGGAGERSSSSQRPITRVHAEIASAVSWLLGKLRKRAAAPRKSTPPGGVCKCRAGSIEGQRRRVAYSGGTN